MFKVEKDFEHNGHRCVVIFTDMGHRCGYVGVPKWHPLYGKGYDDYLDIKKEDIEHIAKLSMLNLSETEIEKYRASMEEIVGFANKINELDTDGIEESAFASNMCNVFRKDEVKTFENHEGLLENAPEKERGMFKIPKVIQ